MSRRRRNPDYLNLALLGAIGVGLYVLYRTLTSATKAPGAALTSAQDTVSNWFTNLFPPATSTATLPTGSTIVLGTGQEIPSSAAQGVGAFTDVDNVIKFQFFYAGQTWRTTAGQPDSTNTFYATAQGA